MKIDLDALEQKARAAQGVDLEKFRSEIQASLHRGRDGVHIPVRVPAEIDAHMEANEPLVTLGLIVRIRELEAVIEGMASATTLDGDYLPRVHLSEILEKGAVLP